MGTEPIKRVFVAGCPRSGTTWTALLLGSHPLIAGAQHVNLFHALAPLQQWWLEHEQSSERRFWRSAILTQLPGDGANTAEAETATQPAQFGPLLAEEEFYVSCRQMVGSIYDGIASYKPGAQVVLDHSPENLRYSELILQIFPDAYFLHVIRDPRSVAASLRSAAMTFQPDFPGRAGSAAERWRKDVEKGRGISKATDRYREVRYEALRTDGPNELQRILEWLGLPEDPHYCHGAIEANAIDKLRSSSAAPQGFFRRGAAVGWREELSTKELQSVEYYTRPLMMEMGYEPALPAVSRKPLHLQLEEKLISLQRDAPAIATRCIRSLNRLRRQGFAAGRR